MADIHLRCRVGTNQYDSEAGATFAAVETGSNPLLFFPLPARQELPANRERGGITSPFPAQQELPPRGLPTSQNVWGDEGWGSGGGEKETLSKGSLLPSPGFFIYSAYFTILGSSMIW